MTLSQIKKRLEEAGIENAAGEARMLSERFSPAELPEKVALRASHYPLQYILGEWGFWRETYEVNPSCLVPRSDTETLVEAAVGELPPGARFLDLCTGSGCVAVSTLASRPDTTAVAVDLFEDTLALATRNAEKNGVLSRVSFLQADVLKGPPASVCPAAPFDAILSNPPYIRSGEMAALSPEVKSEPSAALCGGEDGLDFYRAILSSWLSLLSPRGMIFFEIGWDEAAEVRALGERVGFFAEVRKDLSGNDRVVCLRRK